MKAAGAPTTATLLTATAGGVEKAALVAAAARWGAASSTRPGLPHLVSALSALQRLKLKYDVPSSNFALEFQLYPYNKGTGSYGSGGKGTGAVKRDGDDMGTGDDVGIHDDSWEEAGRLTLLAFLTSQLQAVCRRLSPVVTRNYDTRNYPTSQLKDGFRGKLKL